MRRSQGAYVLVDDLVGNRSLSDQRRALASGGILVLSGGGTAGPIRLLGPVWLILRARRPAPVLRTPVRFAQLPEDAGQLAALSDSWMPAAWRRSSTGPIRWRRFQTR